MIISRTPFRLSFAGGGTDLPGFYREEEGAVLSMAIDKYMYVTVNKRFDDSVRLSYSKTEIQETVGQIEHPIFRSVLKRWAPRGGLEVISMADIPAGTGLGSSSSFTVGLVHALRGHQGSFQTPEELARQACDIEINELQEPIGKQDQYIAAYGGLRFIRFLPSEEVVIDPIVCSDETKRRFLSCIQVFYTGKTRAAKTVLKEQSENISAKRTVLRDMAQIARQLKAVLENSHESLEGFGKLMHEAWELKKTVASQVSNKEIDDWYGQAREAGAWGGKILGAGGGGFLMIFAPNERHEKIRAALSNLRPFDLSLENRGSQILFMG